MGDSEANRQQASRRRPRMKDIVEATGFSLNTVSLALQHSPLVAEETAKAIWDVARGLKYRPNHLARSLVRRQSSTIGLILTNIRNPILTQAAQAIQANLSEHGYAVMFVTSNHSVEQEKAAIDLFVSRQVDGMLIYPTSHIDIEHISEVSRSDTPVVLLSGIGASRVDTVSFDARVGARKATEHLIGLGHRRIGLIDNSAFLGSPEKSQGYEDALRAADIPVDPDLAVNPGHAEAGDGYQALGILLARPDPPTAVLAANDLLAVGALHWAAAHGIKVPDELSVVGFDNIELAAHTTPPLTTVNYAAADLSRRAVGRLLSLIGEAETPPDRPLVELVEPEVVIRNSTAPLR